MPPRPGGGPERPKGTRCNTGGCAAGGAQGEGKKAPPPRDREGGRPHKGGAHVSAEPVVVTGNHEHPLLPEERCKYISENLQLLKGAMVGDVARDENVIDL